MGVQIFSGYSSSVNCPLFHLLTVISLLVAQELYYHRILPKESLSCSGASLVPPEGPFLPSISTAVVRKDLETSLVLRLKRT